MMTLEQAQERVLAALRPPQIERIPIHQAAGRCVAAEVTAPIDIPPFDNSAMDGYAVRSVDISTATQEQPITLHLAGRVAAGQQPADTEMGPGQCIRIFTGSPLPRGADAVLMQEDTQPAAQPGGIVCLCDAKPWENVRFKGEDIRQGTRLVSAGDFLGVGQMAALASCGVSHLEVGTRPRVGILATGSELTPPGTPLRPGAIYESNRWMLAEWVARCGGIPDVFEVIPDDPDQTRNALLTAFSRDDVVITSGGASVGDLDLIKPAFLAAGGSLDFWRIAVRPGKPFLHGQFEGKPLFGLPGNPMSAAVTYLLLVRPALRRLQGARQCEPGLRSAPLLRGVDNPGDRRHFMRVRIDDQGFVIVTGPQASHLLSSLVGADGVIDVPPKTSLPPGANVVVHLFDSR